MTIAFVHDNKAILPETEAYCRFFSEYGVNCKVVDKKTVDSIKRDVEWRLMGSDLKTSIPSIIRIHEYISASVPPYRLIKDRLKAILNARPDFRIFQNTYVSNAFSFRDNVPFGFREVGLFEEWLQPQQGNVQKEFDFVYLGSLHPLREPQRLLQCFAEGPLKDRSLLLISRDYDRLKQQYQAHTNIHFEGPVGYHEVKEWLPRARFGLNYMPDKAPFNQQTSNKFLEYAAIGLPVVSTGYQWVREFQQRYGGKYLFVKADLSDLTWEAVCNAEYGSPDLSDWTWERQIQRSGILQFLNTKFPGVFAAH